MTPLRPIFSIISAIILVAAIFLLWTWCQGETVRRPDGTTELHREDWRLLVGALFTAWSFFDRSLILLMVARADTEPLDAKNTNGDFIDGAGGEKLHIRSFGPTGALVLLFSYGWSLDQTVRQYAVRDLSRTFRIVTWDLPGLGRSTVREVSLAAMAENSKVVLERQISSRYRMPAGQC